MKPQQRDELLARLDERTQNMWRILDDQEDSINKKIDRIIVHQEKQNGRITKNRIMIIALASFLSGAGILEGTNIINLFG